MIEGLSTRYPGKTFYLGQVFNDTTNSYKLVWFLAILSLLRRNGDIRLALPEILKEMAVVAWHPVCFFRLSLGRQDKLQGAILDMRERSRLPVDTGVQAIRDFLDGSPETRRRLDFLKCYVPTRFLTPWFADDLRGVKDHRREAQIKDLAKARQTTPFASLYWLQGSSVHINESWRLFLMENMAVVRGFAEQRFARYLQDRNPNVPGIINKLSAPTERDVRLAREFWQFVRGGFREAGSPERFRDIYSNHPLSGRFAIDHFLPWSFVAHDLMWNLAPVEPTTNSSKGDTLPDLEAYLPRLVSLHRGAIEVAKGRPKLLEDYSEAFKLDVSGLLALGEDGLCGKYRDVMISQAQIAANQGFQTGWKLPSRIVLPELRGSALIEPPAHDRYQRLPPPPGGVVERRPTETESETLADYLPDYSLAIAAGGFKQGYEPDPEGWVNVRRHGYTKRLVAGLFVTQIVGKSMEPTIHDGAYCVFRAGVSGTRQNRVLLVQRRDFTDPDTGGGYTVKRYESQKATTEEGERHERIWLVPDNPDRAAFPVLEFTPEDDTDLRVIAEFIQMLRQP